MLCLINSWAISLSKKTTLLMKYTLSRAIKKITEKDFDSFIR
jgi:hypothetical protein